MRIFNYYTLSESVISYLPVYSTSIYTQQLDGFPLVIADFVRDRQDSNLHSNHLATRSKATCILHLNVYTV